MRHCIARAVCTWLFLLQSILQSSICFQLYLKSPACCCCSPDGVQTLGPSLKLTPSAAASERLSSSLLDHLAGRQTQNTGKLSYQLQNKKNHGFVVLADRIKVIFFSFLLWRVNGVGQGLKQLQKLCTNTFGSQRAMMSNLFCWNSRETRT